MAAVDHNGGGFLCCGAAGGDGALWPEIFNTDQGVQFTSADFLAELETAGVRISMDGKGRFLDNIFVERLWRSLKYEEVFLKAYGTVMEARAGIGGWLSFYSDVRPHPALGYRTPRAVFEDGARPAGDPAAHQRLGARHSLPRHQAQEPAPAKAGSSGGTHSDAGRDCRDAFLGLMQTCTKLGIAFWDYLGDRIGVAGQAQVPPLPHLIRCRGHPA